MVLDELLMLCLTCWKAGNSPLMYACAAGHEEIVRELLKSGARVEDNNENGHTPLMEAASAGHVGVAKVCFTTSVEEDR